MEKLNSLKAYIKKISLVFYLKKFDFILLAIAILGSMLLADKPYQSAIIVAYVYSALYYIIKNIVTYKGFNLFEIFVLLGPVVWVILAVIYYANTSTAAVAVAG